MQWFKHMSNMRHDIKVDRLIDKYGLEGYGLYVLILECISDRLDSKNPLPDLEETSSDIARKYKIDTIKCEEIMLFCIQQGLFNQDEMSGRIVCHKMYKFLDSSMTGSLELRKMIADYKEKKMSWDIMTCHGISGNVSTEKNKKDKIRKEYKRTEYTQDFINWFESYPKQKDNTKASAFKHWKKKTKKEKADIVLATEFYKSVIKSKNTKNQYILAARNFIGREERYLDYLENALEKSHDDAEKELRSMVEKKYYNEIQFDIRNGLTKAQSIDFYIKKEKGIPV